ncbi:MAG: Crp/Fnr family transcriptional regulator [Candidatus Levybacteria bacterium]|nr:Crp/Fnr family transcriptional regulator [Candidatus Levybacteria bacterium]
MKTKSVYEKIDAFFTKHKYQTYKKGEILVRADDDPAGIFYLKDGIVKEYAISEKGEELVVNLFKPPSFFPMSWAINDTPNTFYFEAVTVANLFRAPKEDVIVFLKSNPDVLFDLLARVYRGTDGILTRLIYLMSGGSKGKLITEILIHAKRFGKTKKNGVVIVAISQKDLASQIGVSRETVNRELKILREKGVVRFNRGLLTITDLDVLKNELH